MEQGKKIDENEIFEKVVKPSIMLCLPENICHSNKIQLIESEFTCIRRCRPSFDSFNFSITTCLDFLSIFKEYLQTDIF